MDVKTLKRGAVSGFVGATVVVLWFLGLDLLRGEPLATPHFIAGALLGGTAGAAIPAYTVLHYMAFLIVGVTASRVMDHLKVTAPTPLGLAMGFLLFDLLFFGTVMATDVDIVNHLGWRPVLIGNLLAGLAVTHTIHRMEPSGRTTWLTRIFERPVVRDGVLLGLVGAAAVALWYLLLDTMAGAALQTPSFLGGVLFAGETGTAGLPINLTWVLGFTVVHVAAFAGLGIALTAVAATAEGRPPILLAALMILVSFEALAMGMVAVLSEFLPRAWWSVVGANLLAALVMGAILKVRHPTLIQSLRDIDPLVGTE